MLCFKIGSSVQKKLLSISSQKIVCSGNFQNNHRHYLTRYQLCFKNHDGYTDWHMRAQMFAIFRWFTVSDLTSFDRAAAVLVLSNGLVSAITCFEIKKIVLVYRGVVFKQFRHCQLKTRYSVITTCYRE